MEEDNIDDVAPFNRDEFESYMNNPNSIATNPVGYSVINQFRSSILGLYQKQVDMRANTYKKEEIMSNQVKMLLKNVKDRKKRLDIANFEERLGIEIACFKAVKKIPDLANWFFKKHSKKPHHMMSSLRDRFCLLATTNGILRAESMFKVRKKSS